MQQANPLYSRRWFASARLASSKVQLYGQEPSTSSRRRSVKPAMLGEPGPSPAQLDTILTAAARVPDHKKLVPWRFIVFEGEARAIFGRVLLKACLGEEKEAPTAARLEFERTRLLRAPTVVAVISRVTPNPAAPIGADPLLRRGMLRSCLPPTRWVGTALITSVLYNAEVRAAIKLAVGCARRLHYIGTARRSSRPHRRRSTDRHAGTG